MGKPKLERDVTHRRSHSLSAAEFRLTPNFLDPLFLHSSNYHFYLGTGSEEGPAKGRGRPNDPSRALCFGIGGFPLVIILVWSPWPCSLQPSPKTGILRRIVKGGLLYQPMLKPSVSLSGTFMAVPTLVS